MERALNPKNKFQEFESVTKEYMDIRYAELVLSKDIEKPECQVFYLPMHVVFKRLSTTTKIRVVFDASAKSASGISLNDILLLGPTVHPSLVDVLLCFSQHWLGWFSPTIFEMKILLQRV